MQRHSSKVAEQCKRGAKCRRVGCSKIQSATTFPQPTPHQMLAVGPLKNYKENSKAVSQVPTKLSLGQPRHSKTLEQLCVILKSKSS